jgi:rhamnosyltransferase
MNPVPVLLHAAPANAPHQSNIWTIVVTHNPAPDFGENVRALISQVKKIIIVDNQSLPSIRQFVGKVASTFETEVIWSQHNLGIASALNAGINLASSSDECQWILMLDQDSHVTPHFVAIMCNAYEACPFRDAVALIGATYQLAFRTLQAPSADGRTLKFREVETLMTSGTLVKRRVFADCGSFDESFFMDYVDHEFCFRVRRHGLRIIQANEAILEHELGSPTSHRLFGKSFVTSNYSPNRRYHNARNRLIFYRRYFYSESAWIVCDWFRWLRELLKMIVVEGDRKNKLASVARGVWDGFRVPKWPDRPRSTKAHPPGPEETRKSQ